MIQFSKNMLLMLMLFCVGSSFSMDRLAPYVNETKKTFNWIADSYKSKTAALEKKLSLSKNSIKFGVPTLATIIGAAGIFYSKSSPELLERIAFNAKVGLACATGLAGLYDIVLVKNWFKFLNLKSELKNGLGYESLPLKKRPKAFRFFGWNQRLGGSAYELTHNANAIKNQFKLDASCDDKIFLNGAKINPTVSNPLKSIDLKKAINAELNQLRKKLIFVGKCGNAYETLLSQSTAGINWNDRNNNINILDDVDFWKKIQPQVIDTIINDVENKKDNIHWFKKYIYSFPGMKFWDFHIARTANHEHIDLFCKLLKAYLRLLGLKSIADTMGDWQLPDGRPTKNVGVHIK